MEKRHQFERWKQDSKGYKEARASWKAYKIPEIAKQILNCRQLLLVSQSNRKQPCAPGK